MPAAGYWIKEENLVHWCNLQRGNILPTNAVDATLCTCNSTVYSLLYSHIVVSHTFSCGSNGETGAVRVDGDLGRVFAANLSTDYSIRQAIADLTCNKPV